jgi:hypothetical protein
MEVVSSEVAQRADEQMRLGDKESARAPRQRDAGTARATRAVDV